ncbi:carbonic anhydrase [Qipengyuania marisflavi]|uniref:carbonic anhydrase n=1 Tax=Qipengyuania marisflavi TaxID=2486356 RepID=A0A5S3P8E3_9SPHN|nr:carbonic anhydrase family protein [Qipengyuania marisflavi]TMM49772.1 carbonic anhydrase family protein [Qipengyuania marisflavi]
MKYFASLALVAMAAAPLAAAEKDWHFGDGTTPERWSTVNSDYALCDAGLNQSPIDLGGANTRGDIDVALNYGTGAGTIVLGTEKVQVDFAAGMGMMSGGKQFNLLQVHFHTPSEHAINGKRFPMVAHFVHATEAGELGVFGVMFAEGAANPALGAIVDGVAAGKGTPVAFDVSDLIPEDDDIFRYMGSLTTPPCSEGVNWHVAQTPMTASAAQIAAMEAKLGPSARSLQPIGTRLVVAPAE